MYDLKIIMSPKFLKACKNNKVIEKAIKAIEDNLKDEIKLCFDGNEWDMSNGSQTLFYNLQSKEEREEILKKNGTITA